MKYSELIEWIRTELLDGGTGEDFDLDAWAVTIGDFRGENGDWTVAVPKDVAAAFEDAFDTTLVLGERLAAYANAEALRLGGKSRVQYEAGQVVWAGVPIYEKLDQDIGALKLTDEPEAQGLFRVVDEGSESIATAGIRLGRRLTVGVPIANMPDIWPTAKETLARAATAVKIERGRTEISVGLEWSDQRSYSIVLRHGSVSVELPGRYLYDVGDAYKPVQQGVWMIKDGQFGPAAESDTFDRGAYYADVPAPTYKSGARGVPVPLADFQPAPAWRVDV